jgi:large subunit ribosomal protein L27
VCVSSVRLCCVAATKVWMLRSAVRGGIASALTRTCAKEERAGCGIWNPAVNALFARFASKKQGGSSSNGRDSNPKFLGLKKGNGEVVRPGHIIARQRGTKWHPGVNCGIGKDHTIFALVQGKVCFSTDKLKGRKIVHVAPLSKEHPKYIEGVP